MGHTVTHYSLHNEVFLFQWGADCKGEGLLQEEEWNWST